MAEKDLGYRRVQCTGRGSFIISLPKEWVQDIGLKRGSEIAFNLEPDSSLNLVPRKIKEKSGAEEGNKLKGILHQRGSRRKLRVHSANDSSSIRH